MSIRLSASAIALVALLAAPVSAAEPAPPASWSSYLTPIAVGAVVGAVAVPYLYPVVAPTVGGALVTTGGALQSAAPAIGTAALDTVSAAGSMASGAAQSANSYVMGHTLRAQTAIGAGIGALVGWFSAPR